MFAIQAGTMFLKAVPLFSGGGDVYNVTVSRTPVLYKNKADAAKVSVQIQDWLKNRIEHAENVIAANTASIERNRKSLERFEAKLEELLDSPFREVEQKILRARRDIARLGSDIRSLKATVSSFKQDLTRYNKIRSARADVVKFQQTVEAL